MFHSDYASSGSTVAIIRQFVGYVFVGFNDANEDNMLILTEVKFFLKYFNLSEANSGGCFSGDEVSVVREMSDASSHFWNSSVYVFNS